MNIPYHLGIIIDGNRRWAKSKGLPSFEGHRRGLDNLKKIGEMAWEKGIKVLTIFCFSTENWNRSPLEVKYLMKLFEQSLNRKNVENYHQKGIKIQIIGQKERLPESLQNTIKQAEELTKDNTKGILNLAISYGGRSEIVQAVKNIVQQNIPVEDITEEVISLNLWVKESHPDLVIRSGGEQRLSNFLTWQTAYSELYFTDKYWPDFDESDLDQALDNYSERQRRYGK